MNSHWLEQHERNLGELQNKGFGEKKKAVVITAMIFLVLIGIVLGVGASNPDYNGGLYAACIGGMGIFIILVLLLAGKGAGNRDLAKGVRENLQKILTTQNQIALFDSEMLAKPLCDFAGGDVQYGHMIITEHFMGITYPIANLPDYRFAWLSDIKEMRFVITRDQTKAFAMGKEYIVDLLGADGKKCFGISVHGREKMDEFEDLLKRYCPGIKLQEHKLFT